MATCNLRSSAVKVDDPHAFEEGNDQQRNVARKVVKESEDVVATAMRENQGDEEATTTKATSHDLLGEVGEQL